MISVVFLVLIAWLIAELIELLRNKKAVKISGHKNNKDITHRMPHKNYSHPYKYLDTENTIELYEKIDGEWIKTGIFYKSTRSIQLIEATKDTLFLLTDVYWNFRNNGYK